MNKSQSPNKQNCSNYRKTVQNYTISYCQKQFLGKSLYGQVRLGYQTTDKKVKAFRINPLPMSQQAKTNLTLQKYYSQLPQSCRIIYSQTESQSNRYTAMQYFPKTFKTELAYFRKLTKNLQPYIEKFLQAYAVLYYYRIAHGNISLDNIGITFEGRVKLMDFREMGLVGFAEAAMKDYRDFRNMICFVLEKDRLFPARFEVFDDPEGNWEKLFSVWHVVNIYQYVYREKKDPLRNMIVLLSKLEASIYSDQDQNQTQNQNQNDQQTQNSCIIHPKNIPTLLRIALRLLILSNLKKLQKAPKTTQTPNLTNQIFQLQKILSLPSDPSEHSHSSPPHHDTSFYNSLLWSSINDPAQYRLGRLHRLTLILCLIPSVNHQYFYMEICREFEPAGDELGYFGLYADCLVRQYAGVMVGNLIQE